MPKSSRFPDDPDQDPKVDFSDALGELIMSFSGKVTMGEIVGALEIHKLQIVIQNSGSDADESSLV
jgi:hypothetical protein